jgi:hypothetical protein
MSAPDVPASPAVAGDVHARAKVFLSYCHADPNVTVVHAVHTALANRYDVFCDIGLQPGTLWAAEIGTKLADADYYVVFLSSEAATSKAVTEEARRAVKRQSDTGRPRIIPVPLAYDVGDLGFELGALLKPFQFIFWQTPEDTDDLITDLDRVFTGAWGPPAYELAPALSRYLMSETRGKRIREAFVPPPTIGAARDALRSGRILWITGAPGVGKQYLASALACDGGVPVFELRHTLSWRQIFQHRPRKSMLVIPEALVPERAGTGEYEAELAALRQICETDNTILLTCTDEEYTSRNSDLVDAGFTAAHLVRYRLAKDTYTVPLRAAIMRNLVAQSHSTGIISLPQRKWIEQALSGASLALTEWTLGELEAVVTRALPTAVSAADVAQLLERHATVEDEVHRWFLDLDEAARALLLTLLLFPDATAEHIWTRFRAILAELEELRLIPRTSVPTLGVCRARCVPYVTQADDLEIADSAVASAIAHELAVSWREYLLELRPLLRNWALPPPGQDRALTRMGTDESAAVRQEVARLIGELLKVRVEDVLPFLDDFATFDQSAVRRAAAEAIVHAFGSDAGERNCRRLLRGWEADRSAENAAIRRREVAADACWRIAARGSGTPQYTFALEQLHRHTRDIPRVRAVVAYGISRIVSRRTIRDLQPLLTRLARDQDEIVRRRAGVALTELARRDADAADAVFAAWCTSKDSRQLWSAAYSLFVAPRAGRRDREKLHAVMEEDAVKFGEALASALTPGDEARDTDRTEAAIRALLRLVADEEAKGWCAEAIGAYWAAQPDGGARLCARLASASEDSFGEFLVQAYVQRLFVTMTVSEFQQVVLTDVRGGGIWQKIATRAVASILAEASEDILVNAEIASAWAEKPTLFEQFLTWVRNNLGEDGRRTIVFVRRGIMQSLFGTPGKLVTTMAAWLRDTEMKHEVSDAIHGILQARELWSKFAAPLIMKYWDVRDDVWEILDALDADSATLVREVAFEDLLKTNPVRFIACAIEETQDLPKVRADVMRALGGIAKKNGAAMAAAVRRAAAPTNRPRILQLIRDFDADGAPLKKIADDLWLTRLWLSFVQLFSSSTSN